MQFFRFLRRRLQSLGLKPRDARFVALYFDKQLRSQGLTRGTTFLKQVGETIVNAISGESKPRQWVKTHARFPKALICLRTYPESVQLRISKFARTVRFQKVTTDQVVKFGSAVRSASSADTNALREMSRISILGLSHLGYTSFPTSVTYPSICRQFHKVLSRSGPVPLTMEPPVMESLERVIRSPFSKLPNWEQAFEPAVVPVLSRGQRSEPDSYVGKIFVTQEGGGKARFYAAPYTAYQVLLTPLHEWLKTLRNLFPSDCTNMQEAGAVWAQNLLKEGETVVSADTRNATDRYPYQVQRDLLVYLGCPPEFLEALDFIVRGEWEFGTLELKQAFQDDSISWLVGQPLGIRPSMSLYGLAHNAFLRGLAISQGLDPNNSFRILGDDVVMVLALYQAYRQGLEQAGVEFSDEKTHVSTRYAEFAGYQITPGTMVRPGQWKPAGVKNHLSIAVELGKVLQHETAEALQVLQSVVLFGKSQYDPPTERWSGYIRANTTLLKELEYPRTPVADTFSEGLLQSLKRQTGLQFNNLVRPAKIDYLAPFVGLPRNSIVENFRYVAVEVANFHISGGALFMLQRGLELAFYSIQEMLLCDMISYAEAMIYMDKANAACMRELFLPPKVERESWSNYHLRVQKIVRETGLSV